MWTYPQNPMRRGYDAYRQQKVKFFNQLNKTNLFVSAIWGESTPKTSNIWKFTLSEENEKLDPPGLGDCVQQSITAPEVKIPEGKPQQVNHLPENFFFLIKNFPLIQKF